MNRIYLYLHDEKEKEHKVSEFIKRLGHRKSAVICSIIYRFMQERGVSDASQMTSADFKRFIASIEYLPLYQIGNIPASNSKSESPTAEKTKGDGRFKKKDASGITKDEVTSDDADFLRNAMDAFF